MKKNPIFIILAIIFVLNTLAWLAVWPVSNASRSDAGRELAGSGELEQMGE